MGPGTDRSRASSLSQLNLGLELGAPDNERNAGGLNHPGVTVDPLDKLPDVGGRSGDAPIPSNSSVGKSYVGKYKFAKDGIDINAMNNFRSFTTGQPRVSYLRTSPPKPGYPAMARRSTLADAIELDHKLYAQRITMDGQEYLPLNIKTVQILAPYLNGAKPVADTSLFKSLVVTVTEKDRHLEHLLLALASIGKYCEVLLIVGEEKVHDLDGVYRRWEPVLKWCHQLRELVLKGK